MLKTAQQSRFLLKYTKRNNNNITDLFNLCGKFGNIFKQFYLSNKFFPKMFKNFLCKYDVISFSVCLLFCLILHGTQLKSEKKENRM